MVVVFLVIDLIMFFYFSTMHMCCFCNNLKKSHKLDNKQFTQFNALVFLID